ncbi:MAG: PKD domain-containing protein [Bacteroidetes bacterium]|nr:PKD domain-containing protein [Bacteroidota bacterium]
MFASMIKTRVFISLVFTGLCSMAFAQNLSNKGKEFWVGYGAHVAMWEEDQIGNPPRVNPLAGQPRTNGGAQEMVLYFTSDKNSVVTVDIPSIGWTRTYAVTANAVTTSDPIPKSTATGGDVRLVEEGLSNKGIHITATIPIIAYAHIFNQSVSGATLLFPVSTLSREYYSLNFTQVSNQNYSYCFAYVVATEDNTTIEIEPSANTIRLTPSATPFRIVLNKGEIYNIFGRLNGSVGGPFTGEDLTGTIIRSVATATSPCKKIAVFSGSGKLSISCRNNAGSSDNYMQQAFPTNAWGKKYLTAPTSNLPSNFFRVAVKDPTTVVRRNGVPVPGLIRNFYYEFQSSSPEIIEADKPIMVAQYISTAPQNSVCNFGATGNLGDPEMIYLSPIEQTINKVTINSTGSFAISQHFLNLVIHKEGIVPGRKFLLDGAPVPGTPIVHPGDPNYVYFQIPLVTGSHTIDSDSGFNAIAYGYGAFESYGYNAGTNVIDLNQFVSLQNEFATVPFPSTCRNSPFKFSITLPFQPLKIQWKFNNTNNVLLNNLGNPATDPNPITNTAVPGDPIPSNATIPSPTDPNKLLYVYELPATYKFSVNGDFPIKLLLTNTTGTGCTGEQEVDYNVRIFDPPITRLVANSSGCLPDRVQLNALNVLEPDITPLKYVWDIDGTLIERTVSNYLLSPFTTEGPKQIKLRLITNIGCVSDIMDTTIVLSARPKPEFTPDAIRCLQKDFAVKDASQPGSTTSFSVIQKWKWQLNGIYQAETAAPTDLTLNSNNPTSTLKMILTSSTGCVDSTDRTIDIWPNPVINLPLPESCVKDIPTFTSGAVVDRGRNLVKYDWNFGDPGTTGNIQSVAFAGPVRHFYALPGSYSIKHTVTSQDGCETIKDTTFDVNGADPVAQFTVLNDAALCSNTLVNLQNRSFMPTPPLSFGKITRTEINWDLEASPVPDVRDETSTPDSVYEFKYANFNTSASKTFRIKLRAYSGQLCFTDFEKVITVNGSPTVSYLPIPGICLEAIPRSVDDPLTGFVPVAGLAPGSFLPGIKSFSGPGVNSTGIFDPSQTGAGDFPILYTYTSSNGCFDTLTRFIKVWPTPKSDFSFSSLNCEKNDIVFTSTSDPVFPGSTFASYKWFFSDNPSALSSGSTTTKQFDVTNSYNATLEVVTDNGCFHTLTKPIFINPLPKVDFKLIRPICLPSGLAEFENLSNAPDNKSMSYTWNFGDLGSAGNIQTSIRGQHTFSSFKSYDVKLITKTDPTGCIDSITIPVQPDRDIFQQPDASIQSVDFVCLGTPIDFTSVVDTRSTGAALAEKWSWDFIQGKSTDQNPSFVFRSPGTYEVRMISTSDKGCPSNLATKTVTVHPYPDISAGPDLNVLDNGQKQLQATAKGTNLTYLWSPGTYLSQVDILNPIVQTPAEDIVYTLSVTGIGGCTRTDKVAIRALKSILPPNTFTPNGDGINDFWEIKNLKLYDGSVLEIYSSQGQIVYRTVNYSRPWDGTMNGKPLPVGTYYYVINSNSERRLLSGYVTILR